MKKYLLAFMLGIAAYNVAPVYAQDTNNTTQVDTGAGANTAPTTTPTTTPAEAPKPQVVTETSAHQTIKKYFIDGGWFYMAIILVCLIFGLAVAIERVITLSLASVNTKKLLADLEKCVKSGDFAAAREICKATPGPTAEVLGEGLRRVDDGIDAVEKAIVSNASVQTGLLEKGLVWIALNIALAPMLGFFGTVVGMIFAFDAIEAAGDIRPSDVAGGIKVALLTTVLGLIVAMILQVFYNYLTAKMDAIVNNMEDATIGLIDVLIDNGYARPKE